MTHRIRIPEPDSPAFIFLEIVQAIREHDIPSGRLHDLFQNITEQMQYRAALTLIEILVKGSIQDGLDREATLLYITNTGLDICDDLDATKARTTRLLEALRQDFPTQGPSL